MWTENFQMYKLGLEKAEEPEIQLPPFIWSQKKQENSRKKIYLCFTEYENVFDCVDHKKILENSLRTGYTRPFYLSPEKPVCSSWSNS